MKFSNGLSAIKLNQKWGYINIIGEQIISCKYDNASSHSDGLAAVELNKKTGFIDERGNEVIPIVYDKWSAFLDGLSYVKIRGHRAGYINKSGVQYWED